MKCHCNKTYSWHKNSKNPTSKHSNLAKKKIWKKMQKVQEVWERIFKKVGRGTRGNVLLFVSCFSFCVVFWWFSTAFESKQDLISTGFTSAIRKCGLKRSTVRPTLPSPMSIPQCTPTNNSPTPMKQKKRLHCCEATAFDDEKVTVYFDRTFYL